MTPAEHQNAVATIAKDLEERLTKANVRVDAAGYFNGCVYAMAELFIVLWGDMQKAVTKAKKNHPMDKEFLQLAATEIKSRLPDQWGFILFCVQLGEKGMLTYTADMQREDCIKALKEFLIAASGPEEWLKHIR